MPGPPPELRRGRGLIQRSSGAWGEEIALRYLRQRGYELVERNYRTRYGEIDLVMRQGTTLVFVEVKLRRGMDFGDPLEAVTPLKQARIRRVAEQYLASKGEGFTASFDELRFDVVGIVLGTARKPEVRHVKDAF